MSKFVLRRIGLAVVTLFLLSVLVFVGTQMLPGDVGRRILGPFATQEAVDALNARLGTDRPLLVQYWDWISSAVTGDLGFSVSTSRPVSEMLGRALVNSLKLAALAFVIVVPLSLAGGVIAALNRGRFADRLITVGGLSATVIPEFVSGVVLIVVFAVFLGWLPGTATAPPGSGFFTQMKHLILPAIPLVLVLFGYIARITRAGVIEALDADYTRTAILKGLPRSRVIRRDVLRNALLPTIAVIASQVGYLIGGLVVVEVLFTYQGVGSLLFNAARNADFPLLAGGVLVVGAAFQIAMLLADLAYSWLNPRIRLS
ncbi:MAG TPA: ABC transporter permease [Acidimicrobiia bacterium]|jgi:peptide/nickel transport system permease protein|nr:ABC transporter permease [Acidimicrobiia bacterium]